MAAWPQIVADLGIALGVEEASSEFVVEASVFVVDAGVFVVDAGSSVVAYAPIRLRVADNRTRRRL